MKKPFKGPSLADTLGLDDGKMNDLFHQIERETPHNAAGLLQAFATREGLSNMERVYLTFMLSALHPVPEGFVFKIHPEEIHE